MIRSLADRHPRERIVVGTHGNLLALILNASDERVDFDFWQRLEFPDVLRLDFESSGRSTYHHLIPRAVTHEATLSLTAGLLALRTHASVTGIEQCARPWAAT